MGLAGAALGNAGVLRAHIVLHGLHRADGTWVREERRAVGGGAGASPAAQGGLRPCPSRPTGTNQERAASGVSLGGQRGAKEPRGVGTGDQSEVERWRPTGNRPEGPPQAGRAGQGPPPTAGRLPRRGPPPQPPRSGSKGSPGRGDFSPPPHHPQPTLERPEAPRLGQNHRWGSGACGPAGSDCWPVTPGPWAATPGLENKPPPVSKGNRVGSRAGPAALRPPPSRARATQASGSKVALAVPP